MKLFLKELYSHEINNKLTKVLKAKWIIKEIEVKDNKPSYSLHLETEKNKYKIKHILFGALGVATEKLTFAVIEKIIRNTAKENPKITFDIEINDNKVTENELEKFGKLVKRTAFLGLGVSAVLAFAGDFNLPITLGMSGLLAMGQTFETSGKVIEKKKKVRS